MHIKELARKSLELLKRTVILLGKQRRLNRIERLTKKRSVVWQKQTSRIKRLLCDYDARYGENIFHTYAELENTSKTADKTGV